MGLIDGQAWEKQYGWNENNLHIIKIEDFKDYIQEHIIASSSGVSTKRKKLVYCFKTISFMNDLKMVGYFHVYNHLDQIVCSTDFLGTAIREYNKL
jgi:hypothetical protein